MKYADIKSLPNKELVERYKEEKKRLTKMRFQNAVSQI
jgi:ribosomal protein L29